MVNIVLTDMLKNAIRQLKTTICKSDLTLLNNYLYVSTNKTGSY